MRFFNWEIKIRKVSAAEDVVLNVIDQMRADIKKTILCDRDRMLLHKAYKKGNDIALGKSWGWEWEGDHFHKPNGKVVRRTDYI